MPFLLVPLAVTATDATVWIGAVDETFDPARLSLAANGMPIPLSPTWEHWASQDGRHRLEYQRVQLSGLAPRTRSSLQLRLDGSVKTTAAVTTLPDPPGRVPLQSVGRSLCPPLLQNGA